MDIWKEEEQGLALRQGLEFPASETPGWASLFLCPCAWDPTQPPCPGQGAQEYQQASGSHLGNKSA